MLPKGRNIAFKINSKKEYKIIKNIIINDSKNNILKDDFNDEDNIIKNDELIWLYYNVDKESIKEYGVISINYIKNSLNNRYDIYRTYPDENFLVIENIDNLLIKEKLKRIKEYGI